MLLAMGKLLFFGPVHKRVSFLRDTKSVGELSEMIVATELIRAGYRIAIPLGENHRYDLIIERENVLSRVQVKTGRLRNGAILFNCYSVHAHRGNLLRTYFGAAEFFGVYCAAVAGVFLVPVADCPGSCFASLRWVAPKNGQTSNVRWASSYLVSIVSPARLVLVGSEGTDGVTSPDPKAPS